MLCYKDKCFCSRFDCTNKGCTLRVTDEIWRAASRVGLPLDLADFNNGKCYNNGKTDSEKGVKRRRKPYTKINTERQERLS